jgi:O-antigen/teichoic acid export membrane protein
MRTLSPPTRWLPPWFRSWASDSAALLFSQLAAVVATSALAIVLARHLGPEEWGLFSGFLGLSLAMSIFIEFGLVEWLMRELTRLWSRPGDTGVGVRRRAGRLVVNSFIVNVALGLAVIVVTAAAAVALRISVSSAVLLVSLVTYGTLLAASSGLETVLRARRKVFRVVAATLIEKCLLLLLVSICVVLGRGVAALGLAFLIAGIARIGVDVMLILRSGELLLAPPSARILRYVTKRSVPFAMNRASLNIIPKLDTLVLALISAVAAGYYAIGDRALGPIAIVPAVMSFALYPFLARESAGSRAAWRIVAVLAAAGTVIGAIGIALAPALVPLVFGSDYTPAIPVVQVMLIAVPLIFAANPLLTHLYSARLEHRALSLAIGGLSCLGTVLVVGGQLLVGPVGAAAGYVARMVLFVGALVVAARAPGDRAAVVRPAGARRMREDASAEPSGAARPEGVA